MNFSRDATSTLNGSNPEDESHLDQQLWEIMFQGLKDAQESQGCLDVPQVHMHAGHNLSDWVNQQRHTWRAVQNGEIHLTTVLRNRLNKLNLLGFDFNPRGLLHQNQITWEEMFQSLVEYRAAHKTFNVPSNASKTLALWIHDQRQEWRKVQAREIVSSRLLESRFLRLQKIGFDLSVTPNVSREGNVSSHSAPGDTPASSSLTHSRPLHPIQEQGSQTGISSETTIESEDDSAWLQGYRGLCWYYQEHKSFQVPTQYMFNNVRLDTWLTEQQALCLRACREGPDDSLTPRERSRWQKLRAMKLTFPNQSKEASDAWESSNPVDAATIALPSSVPPSAPVNTTAATVCRASEQESDPMVISLKQYYDTQGTWAVKPGETWNGERIDIWLNLRQQEFNKLKRGGTLKDQKRARLRQLAVVGYNFGVERGDWQLESLLSESRADITDTSVFKSVTDSLRSHSRSPHAPPFADQRSEHSVEGDLFSPVVENEDRVAKPIPFDSRADFFRDRDKLLDDLDTAILRVEWNEALAGLDSSIKQAEVLREVGMERAQKWALCIETEDERILSCLVTASARNTSEYSGVFIQPETCVSGVVAGSVEGRDTVRASLLVPKRLRVGADILSLTLEDLEGDLLSSFASGKSRCQDLSLIVSDDLADTSSYALTIVGQKRRVDAFRAHFSSWVQSTSDSRKAPVKPKGMTYVSTAQSKVHEYHTFRDKYDGIVAFEFSRSIHKNKVLGYMWQKHKSLVGSNCCDNCTCLFHMPDMLEGFVESLSEEEQQLLTRLGVMTNFAGRFLEEIREEHPSDPPKELLQRLLMLYKTEPSLRRVASKRKNVPHPSTSEPSAQSQVKVPRKRKAEVSNAPKKSPSVTSESTSEPTSQGQMLVKIPRKRKHEDKNLNMSFNKGTVDSSFSVPRKKVGSSSSDNVSPPSFSFNIPPTSNSILSTTVGGNVHVEIASKRRSETPFHDRKSSWNSASSNNKQKVCDSSHVTSGQSAGDRKKLSVDSQSGASDVSSATVSQFPTSAKSSLSHLNKTKPSDQKVSVSKSTSSKSPGFFASLLRRASSDNRTISNESPTLDEGSDQPSSTRGSKLIAKSVHIGSRPSSTHGAQLEVPNASKVSVSSSRDEGVAEGEEAVHARKRAMDLSRPAPSQPRALRSIMRPLNAPIGYRGGRRVQISDAGDEVHEFRRSDRVNINSRHGLSSEPTVRERRQQISSSEFARLIRQGSLVDVLKAFERGGALNLSRKDLQDLRAGISKCDRDKDAFAFASKCKILDIYLLAAEAISFAENFETWDSSCMLSLSLGEIQLQGKGLEPDATIKATVVEEESPGKWSRLLERLAPLSSRVVFDNRDRFVCRYNKQAPEDRILVIRLKTFRNVKGDNGLFLGAGKIRLVDAYESCRDNGPEDWHDYLVKVSPHHYEIGGAIIEAGGRLIVRLNIRDIEHHTMKLIHSTVDQLIHLNSDLEGTDVAVDEFDGLKLTGDIFVAKSSLLHAAVATADIELVAKLIQLGAKPFADISSSGPAIAFATSLALAESKESGNRRHRLEKIVQIMSSSTVASNVSSVIDVAEASVPEAPKPDGFGPGHNYQPTSTSVASELTELPQITQKYWMMPEYWVRWICRAGATCKRGFGSCTFIHVHPSLLPHLNTASQHERSLSASDFSACAKLLSKLDSAGRKWYTAAYTSAMGRKVLKQEIIFVEGGRGRQNADGVWWYESEEAAMKALERCVAVSLSLRYANSSPRVRDLGRRCSWNGEGSGEAAAKSANSASSTARTGIEDRPSKRNELEVEACAMDDRKPEALGVVSRRSNGTNAFNSVSLASDRGASSLDEGEPAAVNSQGVESYPSLEEDNLPLNWERLPPHVLAGANGSMIIEVDGDPFIWFKSKWILKSW